nr:MAG: hypothetical protein [Bacteriophage sp.]
MDIFDKIGSWFQVIASGYFVLFTLFQLIRTLVKHSDTFYFLCFAAMLFLSWRLFRLSLVELKELKKGGKK